MGSCGLLIFVLRGTWRPISVTQVHTIRRNYQELIERGITPVFISPEAEDSVWTFKISQPHPLPFALHADPKRTTTQMFVIPENIGILPAVYLLNRERQIVWTYIGEHSEDRPNQAQLIEAISHLGQPC